VEAHARPLSEAEGTTSVLLQRSASISRRLVLTSGCGLPTVDPSNAEPWFRSNILPKTQNNSRDRGRARGTCGGPVTVQSHVTWLMKTGFPEHLP